MQHWSTGIQAATILLREGLEAILIIAALGAFLRKMGAQTGLKPLYAGAGAAVVASFGMAWVLEQFFGGVHSDLIEGGVMILAAGLMFYMSGWLILKQDPRAWTADLKRAAERAVGAGTALSVAGISFLAVFREGGETVLFLHALATGDGGWSFALIAGLVVATFGLVVLFIAIEALAMRLPLRPVFLVTSAFLFGMGVKMVGEAIQEFQEQALVTVNTNPLSEAVYGAGFNGSTEALAAQAAIVVIAILSYLVALRPRLRRAAAAAA
jgi:high-affinity iron transporter